MPLLYSKQNCERNNFPIGNHSVIKKLTPRLLRGVNFYRDDNVLFGFDSDSFRAYFFGFG